ncbi:MAG: ABC transporter ATP-binding protein [Melioribacteraceae bacterium]|nr:MAG: ABC transporter ATP-binding protein [Melioribacteraceae bacterium]
MILKAENIYKSFVKSKEQKLDILKGISLELEVNKITEIVGASGAGKSTLLHILSGLDTPDTGKVEIEGTEIFKLSDDKLSKFRNKNIGFIFQFHHLLPEFTALENVSIPMMINGISLKNSLKKSEELLETVGLKERFEHKPAELSGGEAQRVAVARALANNPKIIFADEPTGNLDSANSEIMHNLFVELKEKLGLTFLIVTHNPELVKLADTVLEMKDGKFVSN